MSPYFPHLSFALYMLESDAPSNPHVADAVLFSALFVLHSIFVKPETNNAATMMPVASFDIITTEAAIDPDKTLDKNYIKDHIVITRDVLPKINAAHHEAPFIACVPLVLSVGGKVLHVRILTDVCQCILKHSGNPFPDIDHESVQNSLQSVPNVVNLDKRTHPTAINIESTSIYDTIRRLVPNNISEKDIRTYMWKRWTRIEKVERPTWWTLLVHETYTDAIRYFWRSSAWMTFIGKLAHGQRTRLSRKEAMEIQGPVRQRFEIRAPITSSKIPKTFDNLEDTDDEEDEIATIQVQEPPKKKIKINALHKRDKLIQVQLEREKMRHAAHFEATCKASEYIASLEKNVNVQQTQPEEDPREHIHAASILAKTKKKKDVKKPIQKNKIVFKRQLPLF